MVTVWWLASGITYNFLNAGETISAEKYCHEIDKVSQELQRLCPALVNRKRPILPHDNSRALLIRFLIDRLPFSQASRQLPARESIQQPSNLVALTMARIVDLLLSYLVVVGATEEKTTKCAQICRIPELMMHCCDCIGCHQVGEPSITDDVIVGFGNPRLTKVRAMRNCDNSDRQN
uniref:Uncharacterized protein n=1 Tax=Heterorhabditis bacteriophora TaxID=37862 RepID=A0A1I7XBJ3_HETBA